MSNTVSNTVANVVANTVANTKPVHKEDAPIVHLFDEVKKAVTEGFEEHQHSEHEHKPVPKANVVANVATNAVSVTVSNKK
jgi:hypothetical protein